MARKKFLEAACFVITVGVLLRPGSNPAYADQIIATNPNTPGHYVTVDDWRVQNEIQALKSGTDPTVGVIPATLTTSMAVSHGADVRVLNATSPRRAPPGAAIVGIAVPRPYPISSCQAITHPGYYVLMGDIAGDTSCLTLNKINDVTLECDGHSISANSFSVGVQSAQNFTMLNCNIPAVSDGFVLQKVDGFKVVGDSITNIEMSDSQNGQLSNNQLGSVDVGNSQNVQFADNQIIGGYIQFKSSYITLTGNTVTYTANSNQNGISLAEGNHNTVAENQIEGGFTGYGATGYDDGILFNGEDQDTIQNNTIKNVYDAGLEMAGNLSHTLIANNTITNVGNTGIFGSYESSWQNNTISGNTVSQAPTFAVIAFYPTNGYDGSTVYFQNNSFTNNTFHSGAYALYPSLNIHLNTIADDGTPLPLIAGNNLLKNNNFGTTTPTPCLQPAGAFIDGGGNIVGGSNAAYCKQIP